LIRDVDLVSYLPEFMQEYIEPVAALKSVNQEFDIAWRAVDRTLNNRFIATADEYGISRFEKLLDIYPESNDTLESRRSRVRSKWFNQIPYTMKVLLQKLTVLCGDADFTLTNNFETGYTLTLETDLELYGQVEELEDIINTMLPCNIVVDSRNNIPCTARGYALFQGGVCFCNKFVITNDFREIYGIEGAAALGGGTIHTDMLNITNDSRESMTAYGTANIRGGITDTGVVTVSEDFNEIYEADGDVKTASGVVRVDFIEIKTT
jgi:hypothetical protein